MQPNRYGQKTGAAARSPRVEAYILAAILARKQAAPAALLPRKHTVGQHSPVPDIGDVPPSSAVITFVGEIRNGTRF